MNYARIQPIREAIKPKKQAAKRHYGTHPYFTKRAWNVVQEYIKRFSQEGDLVLDPFGGSGVTAVESLVLKRKAIYVDISEWACFLAEQIAIAPVDISRIQEGFGLVEKGCRRNIEALYDLSDSQLCRRRFRHWYPQGMHLPDNADVRNVEDLFTKRMLLGLSALLHHIRALKHTESRNLLLLAFSATLGKVNRTFISARGRKESRGGSSIFSIYRYKVAKSVIELNVWEQFESRVQRLIKAKAETNKLIDGFYQQGDTAVFRKASATRLSDFLPPESVDYIYTDPPYGGHIGYLDLSTMWNAWLGFDVTQQDRCDEVVEGGSLHKTADDYCDLLTHSLQEMHQVLKPSRWLSLVFAHKDLRYWDVIVSACEDAGFEYANTVVQPAGVIWSMHKKKNPLSVLSGELVLNFRKVRRAKRRKTRFAADDFESVVQKACENAVVRHGGASTEELYYEVIPALLEAEQLGTVERNGRTIDRLLRKSLVFDDQEEKWFLKGNSELSEDLPAEEQVRFLIVDRLRTAEKRKGGIRRSQIDAEIRKRLSRNCRPSQDMIDSVLREVAYSPDGKAWFLLDPDKQMRLPF